MAFLIFSTPLLTLAQSELAVAVQTAERDAEAHHNTPMWVLIGCIFPGVGLLSPYFYQTTPPVSALIGKSPEYVAYYTDTYKRKTQNLQFQSAAGGCIAGACLYGLAVVIVYIPRY